MPLQPPGKLEQLCIRLIHIEFVQACLSYIVKSCFSTPTISVVPINNNYCSKLPIFQCAKYILYFIHVFTDVMFELILETTTTYVRMHHFPPFRNQVLPFYHIHDFYQAYICTINDSKQCFKIIWLHDVWT